MSGIRNKCFMSSVSPNRFIMTSGTDEYL
uniref:Uncharacterized protein n=1 Tax=Caenorhabditis japonica TaxID=281687 RepID=A0A8R1EV32_CAEJA